MPQMTDTARLTCTRRLEWDAMHRIPQHDGPCKSFHGHRYIAEISCAADSLDSAGRIIDFSVIKAVVGGWIDAHLDHTAILQRTDPDPAVAAIAQSNEAMGKPVHWMDGPPTAENIALELAHRATELLAPYNISVTRVQVWETPNCYATWTA